MPILSHTHTHSKQSFSLAFANPFFFLSFFRPFWLLSVGFFLRLLSLLSFFISFIASPSPDAFFLCPAATFAFVSCVASFAADLEQFSHFYFSNRLLDFAHLTPLATHTLAHTHSSTCVYLKREREREEEHAKNIIKGVGKSTATSKK